MDFQKISLQHQVKIKLLKLFLLTLVQNSTTIYLSLERLVPLTQRRMVSQKSYQQQEDLMQLSSILILEECSSVSMIKKCGMEIRQLQPNLKESSQRHHLSVHSRSSDQVKIPSISLTALLKSERSQTHSGLLQFISLLQSFKIQI